MKYFKTLIFHFLLGVFIFLVHIFWRFSLVFSLSDQQLRTNVSKCQSSLVFYLKKDSLIPKIYIIWLVYLLDNIRNFIFFGYQSLDLVLNCKITTYINDIQVVILSVFVIISFLIFTYLLRKLVDHMPSVIWVLFLISLMISNRVFRICCYKSKASFDLIKM